MNKTIIFGSEYTLIFIFLFTFIACIKMKYKKLFDKNYNNYLIYNTFKIIKLIYFFEFLLVRIFDYYWHIY